MTLRDRLRQKRIDAGDIPQPIVLVSDAPVAIPSPAPAPAPTRPAKRSRSTGPVKVEAKCKHCKRSFYAVRRGVAVGEYCSLDCRRNAFNERRKHRRAKAASDQGLSVASCATCGGDTRITDSRPGPGTIRRRRECVKCSERFTTEERRVADHQR